MVLTEKGALAQLARASAWHAEGHRFEPDMLHQILKDRNLLKKRGLRSFFCLLFMPMEVRPTCKWFETWGLFVRIHSSLGCRGRKPKMNMAMMRAREMNTNV